MQDNVIETANLNHGSFLLCHPRMRITICGILCSNSSHGQRSCVFQAGAGDGNTDSKGQHKGNRRKQVT
jgi:hypothetical protein